MQAESLDSDPLERKSNVTKPESPSRSSVDCDDVTPSENIENNEGTVENNIEASSTSNDQEKSDANESRNIEKTPDNGNSSNEIDGEYMKVENTFSKAIPDSSKDDVIGSGDSAVESFSNEGNSNSPQDLAKDDDSSFYMPDFDEHTTFVAEDPLSCIKEPLVSPLAQAKAINELVRLKLHREARRKRGEQVLSAPNWAAMLGNILPLPKLNDKYERIAFLGDGTYSHVYKVRDKKTGDIFAMKKIKTPEGHNQVALTTFREIKLLLQCNHPNVVALYEVCQGSSLNSLGLVMEYGSVDMLTLAKKRRKPFDPHHVKDFIYQMLLGLKYLHEKRILHRDIKLSNYILNRKGELKLADFGLARSMDDESRSDKYTSLVVTLWYRAPELLLGATCYDASIDLWALELLRGKPLFPGRTEIEQLSRIFQTLGTPSESRWPGFNALPACKKVKFTEYFPAPWRKQLFPPPHSPVAVDLLAKCLIYYPEKRLKADQALDHKYFKIEPESEKYLIHKDALLYREEKEREKDRERERERERELEKEKERKREKELQFQKEKDMLREWKNEIEVEEKKLNEELKRKEKERELHEEKQVKGDEVET